MTRFDYMKCDTCGQIVENCECILNQLMYTLIANYDTDVCYKVHFCSQKCLVEYARTKVKEHCDLIPFEDDRPRESVTIGQMNDEKERLT